MFLDFRLVGFSKDNGVANASYKIIEVSLVQLYIQTACKANELLAQGNALWFV